MPEPQDYYEVLGVAQNSDARTIKNAFRELALKFHPDRNKQPDAEERFKRIAEAYAVLSDPKKRADYDARGFEAVAGFSREDLFGGINFDDIFSGLGFDLAGTSPFASFFGRHRPTGPARGADVEVDLPVPLARIVSGGDQELVIQRPLTCLDCHGTGEAGGAKPPECTACHGTGRLTRSHRNDGEHVLIQQVSVCPTCGGRGICPAHPCPTCHGHGEGLQDERLLVTVPVGAEEGLALRLPGKGMPSKAPGGAPGDLYAVVHMQADPRFERAGADLLRLENLPVTAAVLGTTLTVPTVDGSAQVFVPPGTQPDAVLRLKNKGLPKLGGGACGDLYVRLAIKIPEQLTPKQRALFEALRTLEAHPDNPQ